MAQRKAKDSLSLRCASLVISDRPEENLRMLTMSRKRGDYSLYGSYFNK